MARIIDKQQKKREIALAALPVFAEEGFSSMSVARIAKSAGIGKGTIYLYFESKDEVVLEIWSYLREQHFEHINQFNNLKSYEEKILRFFDFGLFVKEDEFSKLLKLFFDYLGSILLSDNQKFIEHFKVICEEDLNYIHHYLKAGVVEGEFKELDTKMVAYTILYALKGTIVHSKGMGLNVLETNEEIMKVMGQLLTLIKKEKQ